MYVSVYMDVPTIYGALAERLTGFRRTIRVPLREAVGYRLAADIYPEECYPSSNISLRDGYAFRRSDAAGQIRDHGRAILRLVSGIDPRGADKYRLGPGEAVYVETGFPPPIGADAVVPVEKASVVGDKVVLGEIPERSYIAERCSDVPRGVLLAGAGTLVTGGLARIMAEVGVGEVLVYDRPPARIYSVGDEFLSGPRSPANYILIESVIRAYGGNPTYGGVLPDSDDVLRESILGGGDRVIVMVGGTGRGRRDRAWNVLTGLRPRLAWRRTMIYPGKNTMGALLGDRLIINNPGLSSGNLGSLITIIAPIISYLSGGPLSLDAHPHIYGRVAENRCTLRGDGFWTICRASIEWREAGADAELGNIESYSISSLHPGYRYTVIIGDAVPRVVKLYRLLG